MIRVETRREGGTGESVTILPDDEAVDVVFSGEGTLARSQDAPPTALLDALAERIGSTGVFGPAGTADQTLSKINAAVSASEMTRWMVGGRKLTSFDSYRKLNQHARLILIEGSSAGIDVLGQLLAIEIPSHPDPRPVSTTHHLRRRQADRDAWIPSDRAGDFWGPTEPPIVRPPEWDAFHAARQAVIDRLTALVVEAFGQGRILCVDASAATPRLVHPSDAAEHARRARSGSAWFCQSRELPGDWFASAIPLATRKARAGKWMVRCFRHFATSGRRVSAEQLEDVAMKRFDLRKDAVKKARRAAFKKAGLKFQSGNIPQDLRVEHSEVRDFK